MVKGCKWQDWSGKVSWNDKTATGELNSLDKIVRGGKVDRLHDHQGDCPESRIQIKIGFASLSEVSDDDWQYIPR